ncbi:hypothetical protein [Streptomyces cyaneofuscatus]|uniref:hypothetical protein n=1 Tax=Streptomyces cyaneofuscatus TaxID=66883 RepID=UPI00364E4475
MRRFVAEIVRKLLALNSWAPFASAPGPLILAPYEGLVGLGSSSSREYLAYTVTWSGVAYVLGAAAPHNPTRSAQLRNRARTSTANTEPSPLPSDLGRQETFWRCRGPPAMPPR